MDGKNICDILIAGVGGQGQVLASRLIGAAAIASGYGARTAETIGMSQRGGCVTSNVRIGESYKSAAVPTGQADLIIGFELCETVRSITRLNKTGGVVLNNQTIKPVTVSLGVQTYDADDMLAFLRKNVKRLVVIDAMAIAEQAGSAKACNTVLLGAACGAGMLPVDREVFIKVIGENVPAKFKELNIKAFESGFAFSKDNA